MSADDAALVQRGRASIKRLGKTQAVTLVGVVDPVVVVKEVGRSVRFRTPTQLASILDFRGADLFLSATQLRQALMAAGYYSGRRRAHAFVGRSDQMHGLLREVTPVMAKQGLPHRTFLDTANAFDWLNEVHAGGWL